MGGTVPKMTQDMFYKERKKAHINYARQVKVCWRKIPKSMVGLEAVKMSWTIDTNEGTYMVVTDIPSEFLHNEMN